MIFYLGYVVRGKVVLYYPVILGAAEDVLIVLGMGRCSARGSVGRRHFNGF